MIHTSISSIKPNKRNGKYITSEFAPLMLYYILQELFSIHEEHSRNFGNIVVCLDNSIGEYWRKDIYAGYKLNRSTGRDESEINYDEVFECTNKLIEQISENLPWKVVNVQRAEADDIMLVLAREYNKFEKILIHSPDKDMIQAQRDTDNVFQYSSLTKKWLVPETKHGSMEYWLREHVCLGDTADGIPKVIDGTEFTENFINYLKEKGYNLKNPIEFRNSDIHKSEKIKLIGEFDIYVLNRKGESTGIKDIYFKPRFGPAALKKSIEKCGSLDAWLDSHPLYREHFNRNYTLVMEEGIPSEIWNEIIIQYKKAKTDYNTLNFEKYLNENNLKSILMNLSSIFKLNRPLTAEDFGW